MPDGGAGHARLPGRLSDGHPFSFSVPFQFVQLIGFQQADGFFRQYLFPVKPCLLLIHQPEGFIDLLLLQLSHHFPGDGDAEARDHGPNAFKIGHMLFRVHPVTVCRPGNRGDEPLAFVVSQGAGADVESAGNIDRSHIHRFPPLINIIDELSTTLKRL